MDRDDVDKYVVPKILEEVRTKIIPDVIHRLNETSDMLDKLEEEEAAEKNITEE